MKEMRGFIMVYHGTSMTETIWFGPENDLEEVHYIEMHKADDEQVFYVTTCCNPDWVWAFKLNASSNYEMVKFTIMDVASECCCINKLLDALDDIFAEDFADILVEDEKKYECDGYCEQCDHRGCLN
jgi:hypothetical protein